MGIYALYKGEQMLSTGTIYEIAKDVGVEVRTIKYYELKGGLNLKSKWILVWHLNSSSENNDVFLEGVFNTREEAQHYLNKANYRFSESTVFSILNIPIE